MDTIESTVVLPAGAQPIGSYSRNYALRPDGKVFGIYLIPIEPYSLDDTVGCSVVLDGFRSRPCTEAEKAESARNEEARAETYGRAGQSRWFDDYGKLPLIFDGGCQVVEVVYDPRTQQVESAECHGEA